MGMTLAVLALAALSGARQSCHHLLGAEQLWSRAETRWLIVGEDHGTEEEPRAFLDLVCMASTHRKVAVAVEQAASEQAAIDAFLASDGGEAARTVFLKSPIWFGTFKDGRSSQAYFLLFEGLRRLFKAGRVVSVVAFQPSGDLDPAGYEKAMAAALAEHSPRDALVIALVGGVHALRTPVAYSGPAYMPMAGNLPSAQTVTVGIESPGGTQWACMSPIDCKARPMERSAPPPLAGVTMAIEPGAAYSAVLGLGRSTTASPPQLP
jgi:hypothetical protein